MKTKPLTQMKPLGSTGGGFLILGKSSSAPYSCELKNDLLHFRWYALRLTMLSIKPTLVEHQYVLLPPQG